MKTLIESLTSSIISEGYKAPKVNTTCYDEMGGSYNIVDICNDLSEIGVSVFLDDYDESGAMRDEIKYFMKDILRKKVTLVAVEREQFGETAVFVWGPEGVCYENKSSIHESRKVNEARTIEYSATLLGVVDAQRMPISVDIIVPAKYQAQFEKWAEAEQYNTFEHMEGGNVEY